MQLSESKEQDTSYSIDFIAPTMFVVSLFGMLATLSLLL